MNCVNVTDMNENYMEVIEFFALNFLGIRVLMTLLQEFGLVVVSDKFKL